MNALPATRDLETRQPFGAGEMPAAAALTSRKRGDAPDRGGDVGRERWPTHLIGEPSRRRAVHRSGPNLAHNVIVGVDRYEQRQPNYCAAAAATPVGSRRSAVTVATPTTACRWVSATTFSRWGTHCSSAEPRRPPRHRTAPRTRHSCPSGPRCRFMWRIHEPARKRDVNDRRPLRYSDAARMLHGCCTM